MSGANAAMARRSKESEGAKPLIRALKGEVGNRPPFWFMRQAGRYLPEYREVRARERDFLRACYDAELAVEISLQPYRRFAPDGVIVFSDILLVPDALGVPVEVREDEGPVLQPVRSAEEIPSFDQEKFQAHLAPAYEAVRGLGDAVGSGAAVIGFAGAPWTLAAYMVEGRGSRDFSWAKKWALGAPAGFQRLVDLLVEAVSVHLIAQAEAGAEVVQLFDSWAGVLPAAHFERWCISPVREVVRTFRRACPGVPVIAFPRGAGLHYRRFALEAEVDGVSIDSSVPPRWASSELQTLCAVQGNLDPHMVVVGGGAMAEEAKAILDVLAKGPFVFNLGHGVLPETPPEHLVELAEIVRRWPG